MNNLERIKFELSGKEYFDNQDNLLIDILDENGLDAADEYSKENDRIAMLESVYEVMQALSNNVEMFRKVETEFTTVSAAYQYLQNRLKDIRAEINRIQEENRSNGVDSSGSITSYMFFNTIL